jgi:hypothetical protein
MAITLERDERRRWLIARVTGDLAIEDTVRFLTTALAESQSDPWPVLFDARGATTTMVLDDIETAVAVVTRAAAAVGGRRPVALVANDDRLFASMLMYDVKCAETGGCLIRVFRQRQDAEEWLDIIAAESNP